MHILVFVKHSVDFENQHYTKIILTIKNSIEVTESNLKVMTSLIDDSIMFKITNNVFLVIKHSCLQIQVQKNEYKILTFSISLSLMMSYFEQKQKF